MGQPNGYIPDDFTKTVAKFKNILPSLLRLKEVSGTSETCCFWWPGVSPIRDLFTLLCLE